MSDTFQPADAFSFGHTIAQVKQGVDAATGAQAELTHKASQAGKDLTVFAQANMEAMSHASQVFAAGSQDLLRQMAEAGQTAMQEAMNNMRAFSSVKTPKAMIELHATIIRSTATHAVAEAAPPHPVRR